MLQVVDEQDRPVGAASRQEVHARSLRHRAVHVLLFNGTGDLYLQRRSANKETWPGYWDSSCSGHVGAGESYDASAARELGEELRLKSTVRQLGKLGASPQTENEFICVYAALHDGPIRPNEAEIDEGRFFPVDHLRLELRANARPFTPAFREVFRLWASTSETLFDKDCRQ